MKLTVFDTYHPIVPAVYFAVVLVVCMAAFHPALVALSLVCGFVANAHLRGVKPALATARWQIVLVVVIALANMVFSGRGSMLLAVVGPFPLYAESLAYGLCMGAMLMAAMLWFSSAAAIMSSDKVSALLGRSLPVVGLMVVMVMRLVPQFVRRGALIGQTVEATSAATTPNVGVGVFGEVTAAQIESAAAESGGQAEAASDNAVFNAQAPVKGGLVARVRQIVVLAGWSLEDSLEMSDAMRARGWGASRKRTTYQRISFGVLDAALLVIVCALALGLAVSGCIACAQSSFYPAINLGAAWPLAAVLYVVLLAFPPVLEVIEWQTWRSNS